MLGIVLKSSILHSNVDFDNMLENPDHLFDRWMCYLSIAYWIAIPINWVSRKLDSYLYIFRHIHVFKKNPTLYSRCKKCDMRMCDIGNDSFKIK